MSAETINRILAHTLSRLPAACAAGEGEQLLHEHITALAKDFAVSVFLKMDAVVRAAEAHEGHALWAWLQSYPEQQGLAFLDSIWSTCRDWNLPKDKTEAAAIVGAKAFAQRLELLLENCAAGGAA